MRTKTLALSVALGVAGIVGSYAQVYSVNAVGYVNKTLPVGLSIIANPLDNTTGNKISDVLTGAVDGTQVYRYSQAAGYSVNSLSAPPAGGTPVWDFPDDVLAPGEGFWISSPTAATITFVGEVIQGNAVTVTLKQGLNLVASKVPQQAALSTVLGFPAVDGDMVYRFNNGYFTYSFSAPPAGGTPSWDEEPVIGVAEGFWVNKVAATTWTRDFTVNN